MQTYPAIEVIVVDDGSTDNSRELLELYRNRVKIFYQEHKGHTSSANSGFSFATGSYIMFLDADDFLYPNCIFEAMRVIKETDSKIQFRLSTVDQSGRDKSMDFPYFHRSFTEKKILDTSLKSGWYPWTVSTGNIFSRVFLNELFPIDEKKIYRSPDGYLNKLAPLFGNVSTLRTVLGAYRVHGLNAWASAGGEWKIDIAVRWLRFNSVLEKAFIETASKRGFRVRQPLIASFHQLEYRALAVRFARGDKAVVIDSRQFVLSDAIRWLIYLHPDGLIGSVARYLWLLFLIFFPERIVQNQWQKARGQTNRAVFWLAILRATRSND